MVISSLASGKKKVQLDESRLGRPERLTTILRNYWANLRQDFAFPTEGDINPMQIADIWNHCFIIEANNALQRQDYIYKYVGDSIARAYKDELSGVDFSHIVGPSPSHLADDIEKILATKAPLYNEGEMEMKDGRVLKYRHILLPLGEDGVSIQSIMGGFSYKIV